MPKIKAVVFDLGGVLVDHTVSGVLSIFTEMFSLNKAELVKFFKEKEDYQMRGIINDIDILEAAETHFGITIDSKRHIWPMIYDQVFRMRLNMFKLLEELMAQDYSLGLLSNIDVAAVKYLRHNMPLAFDELVFSCDVGSVKPERQIYEMMLCKLQVFPEHAVMIDDRIENIEGAEAIGMQGILYTDFVQLKNDLENHLEITLSSE
ncbi:MAG: HAD-superfamily hydrolase, subfamily IA, variant 3 [candidate division CPR2 bacterium GW2011_GWC1_39_9]|uniref:HAD-superfamily hydrolase, subfamily IA, variant 3 n=1 Tax=candidate division CPR2 bacterium GW2011_GWC2_39_10 TaxID=1618345 RepID=A0A0G0LUZ1_UNCC2|nr:MAG: HAD-superfamily hydrolase, subfamily IA, variant 3 [candidate division CPR2 bacterium GW2011_GWC2_39_10]KKR34512.1 MAG: HAD-superfamily hydrolase, subfamily IA, variant 3 [candidate division CPR2 bacterium GW2011_GWC1_39_9]